MRPPEKIITARLLLKKPEFSDAKDVFEEYAQNPDVSRYLTWIPHENIETTKEFILFCIENWNDDKEYSWTIREKDNCRVIGMITTRINGFMANMGYVLAQNFWNQGYMSEAAKAVLEWLLKQDMIHRVWSVTDTDNTPSAKVLEKIGMKKEGTLKKWVLHPNHSEVPRDVDMFAIVKD